MKLIKSLLVLTAVLGGAVAAQASEMTTAYPYQCAVTFTAKGGGAQILAGDFVLRGTGNIRCVDASGDTLVKPVKITLGGSHLAARVAFGYFNVAGSASGVGFLTDPSALLGRYALVGAQAAVGVGAGAQFSGRAAKSNVTLGLNINVSRGLGLNVGYQTLAVCPATAAVCK